GRPGARDRPAARRLGAGRRAHGARPSRAARLRLSRRRFRVTRVRGAGDRAVHLHRRLHRRGGARGAAVGRPGPDRCGQGARPVGGATAAPRGDAAGPAGHLPAAHQPVPEPHEEFVPRGGDRLSRPGVRGQHHHEPDGTGDRGDADRHGRLPHDQTRHRRRDEPVRGAHAPRGAMMQPAPGAAPTPSRPGPAARRASAPPRAGLAGRLREAFFASPRDTLVTLALVGLIAAFLPGLLDWLVFDAVWGPQPAAACEAARGEGACWAVVWEKFRVMMFATYPYEEQWRPGLVIAVLVALPVLSAWPRMWNPFLAPVW